MRVISVTGGVGSGKSEVLRILQEDFGAEIIIADQVAHQLMEPGKKGYNRVVAAFGASFLNGDGSINRRKMADMIFKDRRAVETINSIIHPMAWREISYAIAHSDRKLVVVEAALFDDEHNAMFDEIWYVFTTMENRIRRLMDRRGYSREKCLEIMSNQASEEEYRALADFVVDNNKTVEEIRFQIENRLKEE